MPRPLKVAHVALTLDVGGLERNIINQIRQSHLTGEQVSVICLERDGALADTARELGATVISANKQPGLHPTIIFRLRSILKELQPDIIHTHQIGPLFYIALAACLPRAQSRGGYSIAPIVHTEHGREPYPDSRKLRILGRFAAKRAQIFYCLTQDMADHVVASRITTRDKIRLIHNGIDFSAYTTGHDTRPIRDALNIPHDAPVIGTIGRLTEIKRQDVLLRAFAIVREKFTSAHLLLIGDGELRSDLQSLASQLDIADRVHFAGYQQQTAPYMQAMNLFALTSRSEGMPQSILEAAVAGIPVIASNVGGIPEVIHHDRTGLLFPVADHAALARHLLDLLNDPNRARTLASSAQHFVESRFAIQRMAREYHDDFIQLLTQTSPHSMGVSPMHSPA